VDPKNSGGETEKTWGKLREEETQNRGEEKATKGRGD